MRALACAALVVLAAAARSATACSCAVIDDRYLFEQSDAIFVGEVVAITDLSKMGQASGEESARSSASGPIVALVRPTETFRARWGEELPSGIYIVSGNSNCDIRFEVGESYLVFGRYAATGGVMATSSCDGTQTAAQAKQRIARLRQFKKASDEFNRP